MTDKQSEALRLADMVERYNTGVHSQAIHEDYCRVAAELRRLHEVNAELVSLLIRYRKETPLGNQPHMIAHLADATIANATGEQQ